MSITPTPERRLGMIEKLQIVDAEAQPAAVIPLRIPREEMRIVMPKAIQELLAVLSAQDAGPAGPMFAHHLSLSSREFDFEVGFPVKKPVHPTGRVRAGELPGGRVLRSVYHGPYEGLYEAWAAFGEQAKNLDEMLRAQRLNPGEGLWERYLVGPESGSDPAQWRTELNRPLVS